MYVLMCYISFGVLEQQIQVCRIENGQSEIIECSYSTLNNLGETFKKLSEIYSTNYIRLPLNPEIEAELVVNYGFEIYDEKENI